MTSAYTSQVSHPVFSGEIPAPLGLSLNFLVPPIYPGPVTCAVGFVSWSHDTQSVELLGPELRTSLTARAPGRPQTTATLRQGGRQQAVSVSHTATVHQHRETVTFAEIWGNEV